MNITNCMGNFPKSVLSTLHNLLLGNNSNLFDNTKNNYTISNNKNDNNTIERISYSKTNSQKENGSHLAPLHQMIHEKKFGNYCQP